MRSHDWLNYNPKGSKDPNNGVLVLKYYNINGIWALNPIIWVLEPFGSYTEFGLPYLPDHTASNEQGMKAEISLGRPEPFRV